jgi:beta-phosphoglucomutase-like phosphatase (HAD superfamily)
MVHFLFDLDGLLVDSEPMQLESFIELAKRYQKKINSKFRKEYIGKSANHNISSLFNTKDAIQLKKLEKEKQDIIFSIIKEKGLKKKK